MGREISRSSFRSEDFQAFSAKLHDNLRALSRVLERPGFGLADPALGAELEYYILDRDQRPAPINKILQADLDDSGVAMELNRYNLEYNFPVLALQGAPFSALQQAILARTRELNQAAAKHGAALAAVGIVPTLSDEHLGPAMMTPETRYRVLSEILLALRGGEFDVNIRGQDHYTTRRSDLTLEGTCTSFQVHYSFPIERFVNIWNAMTLVTPLVLGMSTNSPFLLGRCLWHETRIPLFKQATDSRRADVPWHDLPRVELGYDWLRQSPYELFAQRVFLYPPLIPLCDDEQPEQILDAGGLPALHELNLHNGTIWHWNRPIYSAVGDGHIRIEMRALPAGPSAIDMAANAAFMIGLATGLADRIEALLPAIPFRFVTDNFYKAAREGLKARLIWPSNEQNRLWDQSVRSLGLSLLDTAAQGLETLGIDAAESSKMLGVIERRLTTRQTGSAWQMQALNKLRETQDDGAALRQLVEHYQRNAATDLPVADWPTLS